MKRHLLIGALVILPLAFVAGRMGSAAAGDAGAATLTQAAPAKSTTRSADTHRNPGKGRSPAWTILRKRASQTTDELIDELFAGGGGPGGDMWLMDHLLATDPERLFKEAYRRRVGGALVGASRRWCTRDPERALPLLLGNEEPFAWRGQEFYDPHPQVVFNGMGMIDPDKGLAMIDALPPGQFESKHYWSLLEGISGTSPEKVSGCFEKIMATGKVPRGEVARLLNTYASADPQAALAWAKSQGDPIPEKLMGPLLEGMSKSDLALAGQLYEGLPVKPTGLASHWISQRMARDNPDLDATWAWLDRNSEPANSQSLKNGALALWSRKNPEAAAERVLANPELMLGSGYNLSGLIQSQGKADEFLARAEQLPPEQAAAIKTMMASVLGSSVLPPAPGSVGAHYETLKLMRKDPEKGEEQWRSMDEGERQKMVDQLASRDSDYSDPALVMKLLVEGKADPNAKGWAVGLARLAIMDSQAAVRIAEQVPPGKARNRMVEAIFKNWSVDDSTAATAWRERMLAGQKE